jgi:hypothetical protein
MNSPAFDYVKHSIDYASYKEAFSLKAHAQLGDMSEKEKEMFAYYELNWARSTRVEKVYQPSELALKTLQSMNSKQTWIVITEGWCGDSAQSLPIIAALAQASEEKIELRIVSRDEYPELLEHYLTNGSMSIPKLIACDKQGNEEWIWGPRPKKAQELFDELRAQNAEKQEIYKSLHSFYAKDKGQCIETEIIAHCV